MATKNNPNPPRGEWSKLALNTLALFTGCALVAQAGQHAYQTINAGGGVMQILLGAAPGLLGACYVYAANHNNFNN